MYRVVQKKYNKGSKKDAGEREEIIFSISY